MLLSDKAFAIYMGHAADHIDLRSDEARVDASAVERALVATPACTDASVAPKAGWVPRIISAIADRAQLPRIARG